MVRTASLNRIIFWLLKWSKLLLKIPWKIVGNSHHLNTLLCLNWKPKKTNNQIIMRFCHRKKLQSIQTPETNFSSGGDTMFFFFCCLKQKKLHIVKVILFQLFFYPIQTLNWQPATAAAFRFLDLLPAACQRSAFLVAAFNVTVRSFVCSKHKLIFIWHRLLSFARCNI